MQKEQYSRVDSCDKPARFENKPIHPLRKVSENPWAAGQAKTNTAEDETSEDIMNEVQATLNDRVINDMHKTIATEILLSISNEEQQTTWN